MELSDSRIVTFITRENLDRIIKILTERDIRYLAYIVKLIEEFYHTQYTGNRKISYMGEDNIMNNPLLDIQDRYEEEMLSYIFNKPKPNIRLERLIKCLVNEELESENREENLYD